MGALQGGFFKDKEAVYIGRVIHDGATTIGLVTRIYFSMLNKSDEDLFSNNRFSR